MLKLKRPTNIQKTKKGSTLAAAGSVGFFLFGLAQLYYPPGKEVSYGVVGLFGAIGTGWAWMSHCMWPHKDN